MALTINRWMALAVVACAMIWFALLHQPPKRDQPEPSDDDVLGAWYFKQSPAGLAGRRLAEANDRLRLLELRDSLVQASVGTPAGLTVMIDPAFAPDWRARLNEMIEHQWAALNVPVGRRVVVAVIADTVRTPHGYHRVSRYAGGIPIDVFLPGPATNGACVSLVHPSFAPRQGGMFASRLNSNLRSAETIGAMLSPCAFLTAFGNPGPNVGRWLEDSRWSAGKLAAWNEEPSAWKTLIIDPRYYNTKADLLSLSTDPTWNIRKYVAPQGIACMANEREACRRVLLTTRATSVDSAWRTNVITSGGTSLASFYFPPGPTPLGPGDGWVMSEMVRTLGPERFKRFWTSPLPVADAFKRASGEDIDAWLHDWATRMYGPATVGPALSSLGLGTGLVVFVAGLGAAALIAQRRRVI